MAGVLPALAGLPEIGLECVGGCAPTGIAGTVAAMIASREPGA